MDVTHAIVFESEFVRACNERALVLQAQGIPTDISEDGDRWLLLVPLSDAAFATRELESYQEEASRPAPMPSVVRPKSQLSWPGFIGYTLLLCGIALLVAASPGDAHWYSAGKLDVALLRAGEWWRAITALTLHVDAGHLSGNIVFGCAFGFFAGQQFGAGIAWLAILASGVIGNAMNSVLQAPTHTSVGASTAIFGALGLLSAYAWRRKLYPQDRWAWRLGPVVGGVALLAYTGTGDERTDIGAHLTGFVAGFLIGMLFAAFPGLLSRSRQVQQWSGVAAVAVIALAWAFAILNAY